jgi:hypothetical protein
MIPLEGELGEMIERRGARSRRQLQMIEKMVRPERFELPTFWFVASGRIQHLVGLDSLTNFRARFICPLVVPQS